MDLYIEEIENSDLSTDVKTILLLNAKKTLKRLKNQKNITEIAKDNAKEGTDFSEKSGVAEEWFDRFMESASFVSSDDMQLIWGKILANEFEKPGSTPPNMTRILSEFTPDYAKAFRTLCSMQVLMVSIDEEGGVIDTNWQIVIAYDGNEEYMRRMGISFKLINELETLGVIKFDVISGYAVTNPKGKKVLICIDGKAIEINLYPDDSVPIGNVLFTTAGEALCKITDKYELDGYDEAVRRYLLTKTSISVVEENTYDICLEENEVRVFKKNN